VLCDAHGEVRVLGERDCSLQRRHQKVLEESPAPGLTHELRARVHDLGAKAARALGYVNAGTVEMLLDPEGRPWFLEVNRRLQVEHPVTEAVFGIDLVAWQLRIAAGERLPAAAAFVSRGHAVEARVYAEDPAQGFLPSVGRLLALRAPEGPGLRVDAAWRAGLEVTPHYDPLLAKVIAHGADRDEALRRLDDALARTAVLGVHTNVGYVRAILADADVRAGRVSIDLLERRAATLVPVEAEVDDLLLAAAAHALLPGASGAANGAASGAAPGRETSPWQTLGAFRLGGGAS